MMRRLVPGLAALALLMGDLGQTARADASMSSAHLTLDSSPGSFIGGGQDYDITYTPANTQGNFNANVLSFDNVNGQPAYLGFSFLQPGNNPDNYTTLDFATNKLGIPIADGTYDRVQRASFAMSGYAGLDVTIQHHGANMVNSGYFTVTDVSFYEDASGTLKIGHFAASFEEYADSSHFTGTFEYTDGNAPPTVPEPSSLALLGLGALGLLGSGWRRRRLRLGFVALMLSLGGVAGQARADLIIGNLPSNDSNAFAFVGGQGLGEEFHMGATSYALDSVEVVLASPDPADVRLQVALYGTGPTGRPGSLLEAFNTPTLASGVGIPYTLTPNSPFTLEANTSYWLVVNALPGSSFVNAYGSSPAVTPTGPGATYLGQAFGSGNPPTGQGTGVPTSFQVNGTPAAVPEPSSLVLIGLGTLGLLGYGRRRKSERVGCIL